MDVLRTVFAVFAVLVIVVIVHEMGHFLVAKRSGIKVDEFAVGFGPRILWRRHGETIYSLRLLPAGGFVKLAGMTGLPEEGPDPGPRAFWRASIPRRMATIVAGGVFNLVFAGLIFSVLFIPGQDSQVGSNTPAYRAGLRSGDRVVAVGGKPINLSDQYTVSNDLHAATDGSDGKPLSVQYVAPDGSTHTTTIAPYLQLINFDASNKLPQYMVVDTIAGQPVGTGDPAALFRKGAAVAVTGHDAADPSKTYSGSVTGVTTGPGALGQVQAGWRFGLSPAYNGNSLPYALGRGFSAVPTTIADTFSGLYQIITTPNSGGLKGNVQGPVGVIRQTSDAAQAGWYTFVKWIGFLSLNLGLFNLLPIPFLDGGRFVFIALEAIRRRRVDPRREAVIHYVGLMLILLLVFYVTFTGDIGGRT
ncbi:MAG TPA: site-2 protease family protein [Candidatus Dormibacteraeota bacterium]|jgi:regulator of sigma E protease|nr:site-2 protease family protein [Candidatus Dormibacteraeota bacterium]